MSSLFDIVGPALSFFGQREQASAAREAAEANAQAAVDRARAATDAATPYTVASLGGISEFDPDKQAALLSLSPQLSDIYQAGLDRSGLFGNQAAEYAFMDPFEAGDKFYQQMQPFFQEDEDKLRTDLETRLLAQGRLGSTGGAEQQRSLEEGILRSQAGRRTAGFTQAQSLIDTLLGRQGGDVAKSISLLEVPFAQANIGRGIGGSVGQVAAAGLTSQAASQKLLAQTRALDPGLFGAAAGAIGNTLQRNTLLKRLGT
tara:strand:+ start:1734 stop:2510 length:777 start_codon:yes stop_codon:yes gene_type:complete